MRNDQVSHVFIDYENLQPEQVPALNQPDIDLVVLVGVKQRKIPIELASSLQPLGARARYVEVDATAPNALDFHIAYLAGRALAEDPKGSVHVVSKDKGFDPLIRYLRRTGHRAYRVDSLKFLMRVDTVKTLDLDGRAEVAWEMLEQFSGKPRTLERLQHTLKTLFHGALNEEEVDLVIDRLRSAARFSFNGADVLYT